MVVRMLGYQLVRAREPPSGGRKGRVGGRVGGITGLETDLDA